MLKVYRYLWEILLPHERKKTFLLLGLILVQAFFELAGIISIYPLFSVLSDPTLIQSNKYLSFAYISLGFDNLNIFLILLSGLSFFVILLRTVVSFGTNYAISRFIRIRSHFVSARLLNSYVSQPYKFFLNKHSAEMSKTVLQEVEQIIGGCFLPFLELIAQSALAIAVLVAVLYVNSWVTLIPLILILFLYLLILFYGKDKAYRMGEKRTFYNTNRFRISQELFQGIKEVKLSGNEKVYLNQFDEASLKYAKLFVKLSLFRDFPRSILELVSVGGVFLIILTLLFKTEGNLNSIIPNITVFAFGGIRVLPAIQKMYQSYLSLRFNTSALETLKESLIKSKYIRKQSYVKNLDLEKKISLRDISYKYPFSKRNVLNKINLDIMVNSTIGIVGPTGAGKSTLMDIILGLLEPTKGEILIDGFNLFKKKVKSWQKSIGYVPQEIFIADDTILKNVALGVDSKNIDMNSVVRATKQANIYDFIVNELPEKFETKVGERGIRISGGQRQRIGLARALYFDPKILVLDEATSSLDNRTEKIILKSLANFSNKKTIIMIAHRLTTVKNCDNIFYLDKGNIIAQGNYQQLMKIKEFQLFSST